MSSDHQRQQEENRDQSDQTIGFHDYWEAAKKRWPMIAGITIAITLLVTVYTLLISPRYEAISTIKIERDRINIIPTDPLVPSESPTVTDFYQTQYQLLRSRFMAERVIHHYHLLKDPAVKPYLKQAEKQVSSVGNACSQTKKACTEEQLIQQITKNVTIDPLVNSRLVNIHYESRDPDLSFKMANAYAEEFVRYNQESYQEIVREAEFRLKHEMRLLQQRLEQSEKRLLKYTLENHLPLVENQEQSITKIQLEKIQNQRIENEKEKLKYQALYSRLKEGKGVVPEEFLDSVIQLLNQQKALYLVEYAKNKVVLGEHYPKMEEIKRKIDGIDREIIWQNKKLEKNVQFIIDKFSKEDGLLKEKFNQFLKDDNSQDNLLFNAQLMKKDVDSNQHMFENLQQRYKQIHSYSFQLNNTVEVIDRAGRPLKPSSPNKLKNILLGSSLGFMIAMISAMMVHLNS